MLLENKGANIDALYMYITPLLRAICLNDAYLVEYFLASGADLSKRDRYGRSPLHYTSRLGKLELAKLLCEYGARANITDYSGVSPLLDASNNGCKFAELLLRDGANVNTASNLRVTPLHVACYLGSPGYDLDSTGAALQIHTPAQFIRDVRVTDGLHIRHTAPRHNTLGLCQRAQPRPFIQNVQCAGGGRDAELLNKRKGPVLQGTQPGHQVRRPHGVGAGE
ncbi:hypothetical protein SARC_03801 [Sphaeroforma arctica JP610]|uniref:Uncharacterized protein n=1 Tax=Sphaeroforma arctica JP610 TaxID=667725 RepID=A0A0L0G578_9EUKA|nr:hypothetical protein SARC_03801 [Sphaeroforma arctica JP610]KNC83981.1 hypothetical protein SARC_03801 [Sphaeroforma arctica JP610]|eukprot:XP_014157883.1 hypothetical protein SARC_03801 [Sphaeroforma arctica JP610]